MEEKNTKSLNRNSQNLQFLRVVRVAGPRDAPEASAVSSGFGKMQWSLSLNRPGEFSGTRKAKEIGLVSLGFRYQGMPLEEVRKSYVAGRWSKVLDIRRNMGTLLSFHRIDPEKRAVSKLKERRENESPRFYDQPPEKTLICPSPPFPGSPKVEEKMTGKEANRKKKFVVMGHRGSGMNMPEFSEIGKNESYQKRTHSGPSSTPGKFDLEFSVEFGRFRWLFEQWLKRDWIMFFVFSTRCLPFLIQKAAECWSCKRFKPWANILFFLLRVLLDMPGISRFSFLKQWREMKTTQTHQKKKLVRRGDESFCLGGGPA
nr:glycerophosphodiester phosphodiesterase GDPD1, chloroplastic-like [Ipomoea batatas]